MSNATKKLNSYMIMAASLLAALILTCIDLPAWTNWVTPSYLAIVLLYWIYTFYTYTNSTTAFFVGIVLDIITDTPLGEHALVLILAAYFLIKFNSKIHALNLSAKLAVIFGVSLWCQLVPLLIQCGLGYLTLTWVSIGQVVTQALAGTLLWLILPICLRIKRRSNFEIRR